MATQDVKRRLDQLEARMRDRWACDTDALPPATREQALEALEHAACRDPVLAEELRHVAVWDEVGPFEAVEVGEQGLAALRAAARRDPVLAAELRTLVQRVDEIARSAPLNRRRSGLLQKV